MITIETLNQLKFTRMYTLGRLQQSIDTEWDAKPKGYNNTIRWNAGHVFVIMETLMQKAIPEYEPVHPEWITLFAPGTSPGSWKSETPSNEEITGALKAQPDRIVSLLQGKLSDALPEPMNMGNFHSMNTVEAIALFVIWHEGIHSGIIHGLNRVTA